ncbi:glutathionylspermidine synthase family protein [Streptomyces sp. NPDC058424]|uniref:glutathionylspermidine synthase family protein n=1 Tax=Streptomyces sp. NPDC058424 TaxID=3346491 RepID=UPI0036503B67
MRREPRTPRTGWEQTVLQSGLPFHTEILPDGRKLPYWNESAAYVLTSREVDYLEDATEELHAMCVAAARHVLEKGDVERLGIDPRWARPMLETFENESPSIYGRFDFAWDGTGDAKLYEYNGDVPAALLEAAVLQWQWLEDVHPDRDQFNTIHERLVRTWQRLAPRLGGQVHFAHSVDEPDEDIITTAYLRDTAVEAGLPTVGLTMEDVGWHSGIRRFVDLNDVSIDSCFKMYPWDWAFESAYAPQLEAEPRSTQWLEPMWKALLSTKALLAVLWELYPGHPNLLPSYLDGPRDLTEWVAKPLWGWEGASIKVRSAEHHFDQAGRFDDGPFLFQQFHRPPSFDGNHMVIGSWVIGGRSAGVGIRESNEIVTDRRSRFVPHLIDAPRSTPEQVAHWLRNS